MKCKLTDANGQTRGETQWGPGVTHEATGAPGQPLCSDGYIHYSESPEMAAFMNPVYGNFKDPILWKVEARTELRDGELKSGARKVTTVCVIPLPVITTEQRVEIAIRRALQVYTKASFVSWAEKWLSGEDRTAESAERAAMAAERAAMAAETAAMAAERAAMAAMAAAMAAERAAMAAAMAAMAAKRAARANKPTLLSIIRQVLRRAAK